MNILFIHGNYPAQFRMLAERIVCDKRHVVKFLTGKKDINRHKIDGIEIIEYEEVSGDEIQSSSDTQAIAAEQIARGEKILKSIYDLIQSGFTPELIFFHGGNGIALYIRELLPECRLIGYFEWYFSRRCASIILERNDLGSLKFVKTRNFSTECEILISDACVVPTEWQASQFPPRIRQHMNVIFDGVDTDFFKPNSLIFRDSITLQGENDSMLVNNDDLLLTYATRGMEPLRGFPEFMKALPVLLQKLPNLKVLIGGRDRSAYGRKCDTHNGSWLKKMLDDLPYLKDHPRITYTGLMNYENYRNMLQRTNLHCYFTKPYVTSWSLFEAAACGAPILTNRSAATTGTLNFVDDKHHIIEKIEAIYSDQGIDMAINILTSEIAERETQLNPLYNISNSMKEWSLLINNCLNNGQQT
jgi:glycosyltransferase involved in cell wall biosynthesis